MKMDHETSYSGVRHKKTQGTLTLTSLDLQYAASNLYLNWTDVVKHQVSPPNYPKALLKLVLSEGAPLTFQMSNREDLERIRRDITERLQTSRTITATSSSPTSSTSTSKGKKRPLDCSKSSTFGQLDPVALAVTRSSLLAANPALRQQHTHLVQETQTLSEDDFWETHRNEVEEEYAKISGYTQAGTPSLLQSHLPVNSGKVKLGVEEMRQIFILYPAVHKAYEEKVPLELSDEQFWRKYLESEYFHRDRGRIGMMARDHGGGSTATATTASQTNKSSTTNGGGPSMEEQDARAAAVGTDDLFSRYDQKLREQERATSAAASSSTAKSGSMRLGRTLAVGQFDLASTLETERGNLLEGPKDYTPANAGGDLGARVIQKYNRHWAMVLHPEEAVAGADWVRVARRSVRDATEEAQAGGGVDQEMEQLVRFADAAEEDANHAAGLGDDSMYEPLSLKNVEAYYVGLKKTQGSNGSGSVESEEEAAKRHAVFARSMVQKSEALVKTLDSPTLPPTSFPPPDLGRQLLSALTKKMAQDSRTEAVSVQLVQKLPEDFRKSLHRYFRRSSELLRHFFGLRQLQEAAMAASTTTNANGPAASDYSHKLARIVRGMETFYREMEGVRKDLPQTETGEMMRKMCLPIMDQLDWAFQLHREGSGGGGGGGFVAVDEG